MSILKGVLLINGTDIYEEFGTFLAETAQDEHKNYDELLKMPALKKQPEVSIREEDGVRTAQSLVQTFEARDITLRFALEPRRCRIPAPLLLLRPVSETGDEGWLDIRLTDLDMAFRVYLKSAGSYSQLTPFGSGHVVALFEVVLREPRPTFKPVQTTL